MNALQPLAGALEAPLSRTRPHAVVIGAGFGGLAAAIRLGARGYRVTVLERLDTLGGRARVFKDAGFTFDAGPTIITAPFLLEDLWALAGRRFADDILLHNISPFYHIHFPDGARFACSSDAEAMRAEVQRLCPDDLAGYEKFIALSEKIYRIGFEKLAHKAFGSWMDMLRILPELVKLSGYRSVAGLVNSHVRDPRLRIALSFHPLLVGGNPLDTSGIYCLIAYLERKSGVHFPQGGTGALVEGMARLIEGQGGRLRTGVTVERILTADNKVSAVRLESGETLKADIVVSNADAAFTYNHLLGGKRRRWTPRKLARTKYSMGLFVWYFGTNRRFDDVPHHTILLGPRHDPLLRDIFDKQVLAADFSLYLHRPTATDTSLAPPGCDAFYVLSPVPNLQADIDWESVREPYRAAIETHLEARVMPGLRASIVTSRTLTPREFGADYLSTHGAGFGMAPRLLQSAWFRPHNKSEEVQNLFLVGAGTHPGAGVPGVLSSARVLDEVVPDASVFTQA
jgi:phytoene desaturase